MIAQGNDEHPRNDSASIVELAGGSLFVTWMEFVRSELKSCDTAPNRIASMVSRDGGRTWGDHRIEVEPEETDVNVYDPSLLRLGGGEILFSWFRYTQLEWGQPFRSVGYLARSSDECRTFGPRELLWQDEAVHSANNTFVQISTGRIVRAIGTTDIWGGPEDNHRCGCMYSDDDGRTWKRSENFVRLPLRGCAEGHVAETPDGRLLMAMRTQLGSVFLTESSDGGRTWSQAQTSGLRSPESMPVLARIPQTGDLLMIWNHSPYLYWPKYNHFGQRSPLTSAVSRDGGCTWENFRNIDDDPDSALSNPSVNFFGDGRAIVTYYATKMEDARPPGKSGLGPLSLAGAVMDVDWFYGQ